MSLAALLERQGSMRALLALVWPVVLAGVLATCAPPAPDSPRPVAVTQATPAFVPRAYCREVEGDRFMMCRRDDASAWLRCQTNGRCPDLNGPLIAREYVWCSFSRDLSLRQAREQQLHENGSSTSRPADPAVCASVVQDSPPPLPHIPAICRQMIGVNGMDCRPQAGGKWEACRLWNQCEVTRAHVLQPVAVCIFNAYGEFYRAVRPGRDGPGQDLDRSICGGVDSPPPFARKPSPRTIY